MTGAKSEFEMNIFFCYPVIQGYFQSQSVSTLSTLGKTLSMLIWGDSYTL